MATDALLPARGSVDVSPSWLAIEAAFGGYVLSIAAGAVERLAPDLTPLSITAEFLGSVRPGPLETVTEYIHAGRQSATARVSLEQGHPKAVALAKLLRLTPDSPDALGVGTRIDTAALPDPETLGRREMSYGRLPWEDQVELRLFDEPLDPTRAVRGWVRLTGDEPSDSTSAFSRAPLLLDPLPSGLYGRQPYPANVPTVEITMHAAPVHIHTGEWHFVTQQTRWASADAAIEDSTLHDRAGAFVAVVRQTRRIVRS